MGSIFWCSVSVLMTRVTKVTGQLFRFASMVQNNNNNNNNNNKNNNNSNNNNYAGLIMPVTLTTERSFQICVFFDQSENTLSACETSIPFSLLRPFPR